MDTLRAVVLSVALAWATVATTAAAQNYYPIEVVGIELVRAPYVNGAGVAWDVLGLPDFIFELRDADGRLVWRGAVAQDAPPAAFPLRWGVTPAVEVYDRTRGYLLALYDQDVTEAEFVGWTEPWTFESLEALGWPYVFTVSDATGSLVFRVYVDYLG